MKKTLLLLCLSLVTSCLNREEYPVLLENLTLPQEMNPRLSALFTGKHLITPLETTPESLIGRIGKIRKFQGYYYILSDGQSILRFNEAGKFISSLNKTGQGPDEYHRIEDFDVYDAGGGQTEVWVSDNLNLKVYDAADFSYKYKIAYPFVIHKFKRMENGHILLVTGQSDYSLTLTDEKGNILSEYLEKEFPFLMFRPVQFVACGSEYLYQLGISNTFVAFNPDTETFRRGNYSKDKSFLSDKQLLQFYESKGMEFIMEANRGNYINNVISYYNDIIWVNTYKNGRNYLTKVLPDKTVSTVFSVDSSIENDLFGLNNSSFISTITMGESDDSLILYIDSYILSDSDSDSDILDKYGNKILLSPEDNPCMIEFR